MLRQWRCPDSRDHIYLLTRKINREGRQSLHSTICRAVFDRHVLSFKKTSILETLAKCSDPDGVCFKGHAAQEADDRPLLRLLCSRGKRSSRCASQQANEFTPSHARPSSTMMTPHHQMIGPCSLGDSVPSVSRVEVRQPSAKHSADRELGHDIKSVSSEGVGCRDHV
jgi:hypothetical protein